jgi:hypothetical protein
MRTVLIACALLVGGSVWADEGVSLEAAKDWLGALREHDATKLKAATSFPFTEAGIGPGSRPCGKTAKASSKEDFNKAIDCMISDADFVQSVSPSVDAKTVSLKQLDTATFKKNLGRLQPLAKDHTFVRTTVTGDGTTYNVLLAVKRAAGVSLVLVEPKNGD